MPVFIGLAAIAGCTGGERATTTTTLTTPTASVRADATATPTVTAAPSPKPVGNGIAELKPVQILDRATKATKAAKSVRVRGQGTEEGEAFGIDLLIQGSKAAGYLTFEDQRLDLILNGEAVYLKGDREFWIANGGREMADLFAGKYLKTTVDNGDFTDLIELASLTDILAEITREDTFVFLTKGEPTKINGIPAIPIGDLTKAKVYVATEGEPYILRIDAEDEDYLEFLDYGKTPDVEPPADEVIDLEELDQTYGEA